MTIIIAFSLNYYYHSIEPNKKACVYDVLNNEFLHFQWITTTEKIKNKRNHTNYTYNYSLFSLLLHICDYSVLLLLGYRTSFAILLL